MLLTALAVLVIAAIVVMYACNSFEEATDFLGRNMAPGVKGATLNAVGSSLPELLTTMFLLFAFRDVDGFSGGVATCAGSAVFNAIVIPALCILAVTVYGVKGPDGVRRTVPFIEIGRSTVLRDGLFFIAAEVLLIIFLGDTMLTWWMGGGLMLLYVAYVGWVLRAQQQHGTGDAPDDDEEVEDDEDKTTLKALLTLDFRQLFFRDAPFSDRNAWMVLGASVTVISIACYGLSWSVVEIADVLDVPLYFTTVILAAAATSVPDTVLSVKDAMKGNYDDAVANALGSNIFDICVALGLPLMLYGLVFGNVRIAAEAGSSAGDVQELRVALLILSVLVMPVFLLGKRIDKKRAWVLLSLYGGWMLFIVVRAVQRSGMLG